MEPLRPWEATRAPPGAERQELLQAAIDGLQAHVCVLDADGRILLVNRAWRQFAIDNGGDPNGLSEGANYLSACRSGGQDADIADAVSQGLRDVLSGRTSAFEVEYPCHSPQQQRWFVVGATRVDDGAGPARAVVAHQPVTERKRAEMRLRERQKMEALGTLAGGIAHDFNNLLAAILGNAALALEDLPAGEPLRERLRHIQLAGDRARKLVHQILAFGRGQPHEPVVQPLAPLLCEALTLLRSMVPAEVELRQEAIDAQILVHADATEIEQVLINLGTNAWHALAGKAGTVAFGLDRGEPPGLAGRHWAHLWVSDDGLGMDEATRDRIFDPFFTTKPQGLGTGLGLAVVHGIVTRMGGLVTVDSTPGRGSTFHIHLPAPLATEIAPKARAPTLGARSGHGERVLLLDDDDVVGTMTEAVLAHAGYTVVRHSDAHQALVALGRETFDLVVTDQSMPAMTGLELVRLLAESHAGLPVIITSGFIGDDLRQAAAVAGVSALVPKENAFEELAPTVARVLRLRA